MVCSWEEKKPFQSTTVSGFLGLKPHLRHLLAATFILVATLPLLILGTWVSETALKRELSGVSGKHLLLARNVTLALDRYAQDVEASFAFFSESLTAGNASQAELELARRMGFRHVGIATNDGKVISFLSVIDTVPRRLSTEILEKLGPFIAGNRTTFSDVIADAKGRATIFLTRRLGPDQIAIGALDLGYIRKLQKAIAFGERGHSAIVDKAGNVLAHPKPEWQKQMKNIAKIKPVAKMMAGETGVATFYSPAMESDMISGFTTVPRTGWGVMVPQPLNELESHVADAKRVALFLIIFGFFVAAVLSWFLSGLLVRPVLAVVQAARQIEGGYLEARVPVKARFAPKEFVELGTAFNAMARDVATVMIQRERVEEELRHAHDDLERRVEERTRELSQEIAERRRAEEGTQRLAAAIEELSELFVLYDAEDRLVMCNGKYREINEKVADTVIPGATFEEHQRALIDKGLCDGIEGREEEWLKERTERHKNPRGPFELQRNGKWLLINEQRLPDGSTATVSTDITERKQAEEALRRSEERLRGAIASLQEGFALFDAGDRLVALNDEYLRVSPGAQEILESGGTFEDVIRANVATGNIVEARGREEEFIKARVLKHLNPGEQIIRRFADGSWFLINEVRTPEGGIALSFIDVTEIKQAEEALRESQQRFKDFAEVASDWFWEMDKDLRFSYFSGRNFDVIGFKPGEIIGKTRREITNEDMMDEKWRRHLADLEAHRPFENFSYDLAAPGGKTVSISISGKPVFDAEGNFQGYRGTGSDISARVRGEASLREAKEEAEYANRAKTEFLANMSHELRTPLNSVIGFSDILRGESMGPLENPKYREYVQDINDSGKHLLNLINDILDVSRIERGILDLNEKNLDLPLLVGSCRRLVNDRAFEAGLKLSIEVSKGLPAFFADELRTKQILLNLLSNAIKFTPEGGSVGLKVEVDSENRFQLTVSDAGIGIAPEDIETALSAFGQVDSSLTRKYEGSGLGLPLSKKLVEAHGGELFIESEPGVGTTVTIIFPTERTVIPATLEAS